MRRFRWLAFVCVIALVLAACGRSDKESGTNTGTQTSTDTQASSGGSKGSFGTSGVVCKPGKPSGSPAPGVNASEIRLATFSDVGFAGRPGLNQELFDAATVF